MIGEMVDILVKQFGQQEKNKKKYIKGVENPYRLYYYYSVTREKNKKRGRQYDRNWNFQKRIA